MPKAKTNFTPGPWVCIPGMFGYRRSILDDKHELIAAVDPTDGWERTYNGPLIAQAPAMFAKLEEAIDVLTTVGASMEERVALAKGIADVLTTALGSPYPYHDEEDEVHA